MEKRDWLLAQFEEARDRLQAIAYRMLGSRNEAEDAVQEAWIRLNRSDNGNIGNPGGWLTTVVARVCLDMLRSRKVTREDSLDDVLVDLPEFGDNGIEEKIIAEDMVGPALLLVLDTLTPAERLAFVLHDLFDLTFHDIAMILERTELSTRQLASRARRRVRGSTLPRKDAQRQQEIVAAFLLASRDGDFEALIRLLHPDAVLRADETAIKVSRANKARGAPQFDTQTVGANAVANTLKGSAKGAQLAMVNGVAGATWGMNGKTVVAFCFTIIDEKVIAIDIVMDKTTLDNFDIRLIDNNHE